MADTSNLSIFLKDVANAIRRKKGIENKISPEDFDDEIDSIETGIDTSDATATANDIIANKTAYVDGEKIIGTIPMQEQVITPTTQRQNIATGYHSNSYVEKVTASIDSNIKSSNIKSGASILGVTGDVIELKGQTKEATPTTSQQLIRPDVDYNGLTLVTLAPVETENKTVKSTTSSQTITPTTGKFIDEIIVSPLDLETKNITPTTSAQTINPTSGKDGISQINVSAVDNTIDNNIQAGNIRSGIEILGVQGTYDPQPNLQSKQVTITQNTTTTVQPDSGYDGLNEVEITTDVPASASYPPDWAELGYEDTPQTIIDGFNYAKQVQANWNPDATSLIGKFKKDTNLLVLPYVDTSKATNFNEFCADARHLIYMPLIDTSKATTLQNAFTGVAIIDFPELDTSNCTNFNRSFSNNKSLKYFRTIDTSRGENFSEMFKDSEQLQDIEVLDLSSATNLSNMFASCSQLTDYSLNNIMTMCIRATSYTGTKTLRQLGLNSNKATRATQLENYQAFLDAGWTTGY